MKWHDVTTNSLFTDHFLYAEPVCENADEHGMKENVIIALSVPVGDGKPYMTIRKELYDRPFEVVLTDEKAEELRRYFQ